MENFILFVLLFGIFLYEIQMTKFSSRYVVIYRDINCTYNTKYVRFLSCDIMQPEKQHISSILIYEIDIQPGYKLNARLDVPRPNGQSMNILDMDVDICKFFAKEPENNLVKLIRQSFLEHGNYTGCPQYKDVALGLFNFTVDVSKLPYAPESDFTVNFIYLLPHNIETLRFTIHGSLELRRKRPLRVLT